MDPRTDLYYHSTVRVRFRCLGCHGMQVGVDVDDSSYLFNVAMMDALNITSVYAGTNVSFTSTDYQDCVADPDCASQVLTVLERNAW